MKATLDGEKREVILCRAYGVPVKASRAIFPLLSDKNYMEPEKIPILADPENNPATWITVIDPAAQGKNSHNVCIQEGASKDGCPKCTYGAGGTKGSCGTCTKAHLSGSAADNWQEPTAERRDLNWGIFSKHYAVGGIAGKGPVGPDGKSHCASMETYAKMPIAPKTDKGKGGRGKGARGGARGRGGGRGA